jgi:ankyrin repeat protein
MFTRLSAALFLIITPLLLFAACSTPQQSARKELDQKGFQFTEQAFFDSAGKGDVDAVKLFLAAGMNPNAANSDGKPALVAATLAGNEAIVDELLDGRADINIKSKDGQTPLMGAAVNGNPRVVNILLSRGADLNVKDSHEFTALMYADGANKPEVRAVLVKAGATDWHPAPLETPKSPIPLPKKKLEKS